MPPIVAIHAKKYVLYVLGKVGRLTILKVCLLYSDLRKEEQERPRATRGKGTRLVTGFCGGGEEKIPTWRGGGQYITHQDGTCTSQVHRCAAVDSLTSRSTPLAWKSERGSQVGAVFYSPLHIPTRRSGRGHDPNAMASSQLSGGTSMGLGRAANEGARRADHNWESRGGSNCEKNRGWLFSPVCRVQTNGWKVDDGGDIILVSRPHVAAGGSCRGVGIQLGTAFRRVDPAVGGRIGQACRDQGISFLLREKA